MSKRRQTSAKTAAGKTPFAESAQNDRSRPWLLAGTVALFVAAPLLPSEGAPSGFSVSLQMGWLVLLTAFAVVGLLRRDLRLSVSPTDLAMLVFVSLHSISALVLLDAGQPRQTLNMMWHWISFAAAYFLFRQLIRTSQEQRAVLAIGISLAVCLSMHGYYQYFVSMPQARHQFEQDPDGMLAMAGVHAPQGSVERVQFKNRLDSTEPLATFTLANSLAGFLATWLVCAVGATALNWSNLDTKPSSAIAGVLSSLLIVGCFILTKSRTAIVAVVIGFAILAVYGRRSGWRPNWVFVVSVVGGVGALLLLGVAVGALDLQVLTESSKSLLYRTQYWQSSLAMIADSPWFGCGPGNFQQAYTVYKLPESSETIADPHNWLFEIWATAGSFAMLACVAIFVVAVMQVMAKSNQITKENVQSDRGLPSCIRAIYWGAFFGIPLGFMAGVVIGYWPDEMIVIVGFPLGAASVIAWHVWIVRGKLSSVVMVASIVALMVNLTAAGGISFTGVSLTLWLLLAVLLNQVGNGCREYRPKRGVALVIASACGLLLVCFWYSTFNPVLTVSALLARASDLRAAGRPLEAEQALVSATEADTYGVDPWLQLAELRLTRWLDEQDSTAAASFEEAARETLVRHRKSSPIHQTYGGWYLWAYRATNNRRHLEEAIAAYQRAVELYPNYNFGYAQLAWTLHVARDQAGAALAATEALRLDELNPHWEQGLAEQKVFDVPSKFASQPSIPPAVDLEQLMQLLRSNAGE